MAKKAKDEKKADKQAKDVKKLRKAVEELRSDNDELVKAVKKLRKNQEKSREELENIVRDLESKLESPGVESPDEDESSSVKIGADGFIVSGDEASSTEDSSDDGVGETLETSDAPTVSADDGISASAASVKATESAKKKAGELGVNLAGIEGTGSRNRITVADVEKAAGNG